MTETRPPIRLSTITDLLEDRIEEAVPLVSSAVVPLYRADEIPNLITKGLGF